MKAIRFFSVSLLLFAFSHALFASANTAQAIVAYVAGTGTYDDGSVFVLLDRAISSCGPSNRMDLDALHDARDQVLSIAMAALASGKAVKVHPGSCNGTKPVFGDEGDSYFYLSNAVP